MRLLAATLLLPVLFPSLTAQMPPVAANSAAPSIFHDETLHLSYVYPSTYKDATAMASLAFQAGISGESPFAGQAKCISLPLARMAPGSEDFGMIILIRADAACLKKKFDAGSVTELAQGEAQGLALSGAKTSFGPPVSFQLAGRPAALVHGSFILPTNQSMQAMIVCVLDAPDIACWQFLAVSPSRLQALGALPVTLDGSPATPLVPSTLLARP